MPCECDCVYFWSWYYIWTVRSNVLKVGSVFLVLAFFLDVSALVTSYWLEGPDGYTGLFDEMIKIPEGEPVPVPVLCPILGILSAIILFCDNILNLLFTTRRFQLVMPAVIVFAFIGALMLVTVIVTWSVPDVTMGQNLSWSFIVATIAVVVDVAGCGLCVMEFLSRREPPGATSFPPMVVDPETVREHHILHSDSEDSSGGATQGDVEEIEMQAL